MSEISQIADTLPFMGKKVLLVEDHDTRDIIKAIEKAHKRNRKHYDKISKDFWAGDAHKTAKRLFEFNKTYIKYDVEHPDNQSVKTPGAIVAQRHGDCKHYASLINGVCESLERQGYPIHGKYRFVSDGPTTEVHHVFAVVDDGAGNEYWVDPVLNRFNEQPIFHNIKDVDMGQGIGALYSISGSNLNAEGRPRGLAYVGKKKAGKKKKNIFKNIAHGFQVNAANAGKEAHKIEHLVLNVGNAPARNAFLGLLDLNAFNLATRMSEAWTGPNADKVKKAWYEFGGTDSKLLAAINNGRKHKAYEHHQAPAKRLSGSFEGFLVSQAHHAQHGPHHPGHGGQLRSHHGRHGGMVVQVPRLRQAYDIGPDDYGRMPMVSGIGEAISIGAMTALASAMIAVFSKWMKPDKTHDANAAAAAKDGIASLVANASDAIDSGNVDGGDLAAAALNAGGQAVSTATGMQIHAGTDADGNPVISIPKFDHPQLLNAGTPGNGPGGASGGGAAQTADTTDNGDQAGADADDQDQDNNVSGQPGKGMVHSKADQLTHDVTKLPAKITSDVVRDITDEVKKIWRDYKTPIVFAAVGIVAYKVITRKGKKRR